MGSVDRIEITAKPHQLTLNLQERTTVFVLQQGQREPLERQTPTYKFPEERTIPASSVLRLMADYLKYGPDDVDLEGQETRMYSQLRAVRDSVKIEDAITDIEATIDESGHEGARMGKISRRARAFHTYLMNKVEEVWTEPQEHQQKTA